METLKEWVQNWNFGLPGRGSEVGKFCSEYVQGPLIYPLPNRLLLNRAVVFWIFSFLCIFFQRGIGPCGPVPPPPLEWISSPPLVTAVLITTKDDESPDSSRMGVIGALVIFSI